MKTFPWSLPILLSSLLFASLAGCGNDTKPKSMTEGISLSEIEEYERNQKAMEAESAGEMEQP